MDYYPQSKIYHDGSHYIGIPHTTNPTKRRKKPPEELVDVVEEENTEPAKAVEEENSELAKAVAEENAENTAVTDQPNGEVTADFADEKDSVSNTTPPSDTKSVSNTILPVNTKESKSQKPKQKVERKATRSQLFNEFWTEAQELANNKRHKFLMDKMRAYFKNETSLKDYVDQKIEAKIKSLIARKTRFIRKAYMNNFNYFVTFTYNDKLHTEQTFRKKLLGCISTFQKRKGWKYMGVWERGGKTDRLHFHGLFFIPEGTMPGELIEKNDYDLNSHNRKTTVQNSYFNSRFGRCDMETIEKGRQQYDHALGYILKYIAKTGEKIVYSHKLPMYVISDIDGNDVIMRCGLEDKKLLLFDNFACWEDGELIGEISAETKSRLRTSN